jgi:tetraacyldisaccharide 4'-kinase
MPLALPYAGVMKLRNWLYDVRISKATQFDIAIISIGNLSAGGTGKSPCTEFLLRLLHERYKVAVVSRGYGRKTSGYLLADDKATAIQVGDEPMQMYRKFGDKIAVAVGESRVHAVDKLMHHKEIDVVLLDDAYQHRSIGRHLNIMLTDCSKPFYKDYLLPAGRLRESRTQAARADMIIVSKCPAGMQASEKAQMEKQIAKYTRARVPVFFSEIVYGTPQPLFDDMPAMQQDVYLFTGIANAEPMVQYCKKEFNLAGHKAWSDHHQYSEKDIAELIKLTGGKNCTWLTTEKDAVKLQTPAFKKMLEGYSVYYLPIEMRLLEKQGEFERYVVYTIEKVRNAKWQRN